jgi:hypothetical protein
VRQDAAIANQKKLYGVDIPKGQIWLRRMNLDPNFQIPVDEE